MESAAALISDSRWERKCPRRAVTPVLHCLDGIQHLHRRRQIDATRKGSYDIEEHTSFHCLVRIRFQKGDAGSFRQVS
jgi:hypothetical protein